MSNFGRSLRPGYNIAFEIFLKMGSRFQLPNGLPRRHKSQCPQVCSVQEICKASTAARFINKIRFGSSVAKSCANMSCNFRKANTKMSGHQYPESKSQDLWHRSASRQSTALQSVAEKNHQCNHFETRHGNGQNCETDRGVEEVSTNLMA